MDRRQNSAGIVTRLLCLLALLLLPFGHAAMAAVPATNDSAAYVLPDGSLPTLCSLSSRPDGKLVAKPGCDVCRLSASTDLPVSGNEAYLITRQAVLSNQLITEAAVLGIRPEGRPNSRGPPRQA